MNNNKYYADTIKKYIEDNYGDWRLSMNSFVGLVGFSAVYINRIYREYYGITPVEYLRKVRLGKAKELIEQGVPIGRAAYESGYNSKRTFYRMFEKEMGISPGTYKQRTMKTYEQFKNMINLSDLRPLDYAGKMCDSVMFKYDPIYLPPQADQKDPITLYTYMHGMFLIGMYRVYKVCGKRKYFNYIYTWLDFVEDGGKIREYEQNRGAAVQLLDTWLPIRLFMDIGDETENHAFEDVTDFYMKYIDSWTRTDDGVLYHDSNAEKYKIMINSVYMVCAAVCMYAGRTGRTELYDLAAYQPIGMYEKMKNSETGLMYQAYDPEKSMKWADPKTGLLNKCWGRGLGYYIMGILDMLDYLPENHKDRAKLCKIVANILSALKKYQSDSGRWYVLPDKPEAEDNWLENSCSAMFVYAYAKAINHGILGTEYATTAVRGYSGIIDTIGYGENGEMMIRDVSDSVNFDNLCAEKRSSTENDSHGFGTFVLMCTELEKLLNNL